LEQLECIIKKIKSQTLLQDRETCLKELRDSVTKLATSGQLEEAREALALCAKTLPNEATIQNNYGQLLAVLGEYETALYHLEQALRIQPDLTASWKTSLKICIEIGEYAHAKILLARATRSIGENKAITPYVMCLLNTEGNYAAALCYQECIGFDERDDELYVQIANSRLGLERYESALRATEEGLSLFPENIRLSILKAVLLQELGFLDDALVILNNIRPTKEVERLQVLSALTTVQEDLGMRHKAIESAMQVLPTDTGRYSKILFDNFIALGMHDKAWPLFRHRWKTLKQDRPVTTSGPQEWNATVTRGRIYVFSEQGIGDMILGYRILRMYTETFGTEVSFFVEMDTRLLEVLPHTQHIIPVATQARPFDPSNTMLFTHQTVMYDIVQEALSSGTLDKQMQNKELSKDMSQEAKAYLARGLSKRKPYEDKTRKRIGISWRSDGAMGVQQTIQLNEMLESFAKYAQHYSLISLQYAPTLEEQKLLRSFGNAIIPDFDFFGDIKSLASTILECDHVITVSNVTAHLAGHLGVPSSLLLTPSRAKIWYWYFENKGYSGFYTSMRLYEKNQRFEPWKTTLERAIVEIPYDTIKCPTMQSLFENRS